jgi:hypothetical protein
MKWVNAILPHLELLGGVRQSVSNDIEPHVTGPHSLRDGGAIWFRLGGFTGLLRMTANPL